MTRPDKLESRRNVRRPPRRPDPLVDPAGPRGTKLHLLQNTLASLRLRLTVLAADPTCRWAQQDNIEALQRIAVDAVAQAQDLRIALDRPAPVRRKKRRG